MKQLVSDYLTDLAKKYASETSSEYSYRTEFEQFLKNIFEEMSISRIDHDAKTKSGNKPDFVIIKNQIPILYIETKDVDVSLDKIEKSEQMARYFGYANLILTDYVEFRFYRNGIAYGEPIRITDTNKKTRTFEKLYEEKFEQLVRRMLDFTKSHKEPVKSGAHLAQIMGGKAQRIRDNIREYLKDKSGTSNETLKVFQTIKKSLVHDLTLESFADMYAQTVVYGLFVARYYDETPDSFSRQEARDLIPNSNPFLRHFFDHIVGPNFDKRLEFIVDELCQVFSHSDVEKLMNDFYKKSSKSKTTHDPIIHFYEDFLSEYDPDLRKRMGAYYTPTPVVRFMTRSVDELLKKEFGLKAGLADTEKLEDGKTHRVQVLDPAVGTGTFISGVIREIYKKFNGQEGRWPKYVHNDLLPRIHGFELMMAPYTIAHLKLGLAFKETGFKYFNKRLGIYLTNSLESDSEQKELFSSFGLADSIAQESKEAQKIKYKTPVMVVIGNPPYSGESSNAFYSENDVYKQEPGGGKLQERNSKWINDDYVKFFRLAESMIEKTDEGIVCMITAHGYIDNPTFRGMRWHLMKTFDSIYVLDLHGNSNKKEVSPDGTKDENVFNIKTGVSIFFGVKKLNSNKEVADVYKADLYGKRDSKFNQLEKSSINTIDWKKTLVVKPNYSWVIQNEALRNEYKKGFSLSDIFAINGVGIITARDHFVVSSDKDYLLENAKAFRDSETDNEQELCTKLGISNKKGWDALKERNNLRLAGNLESYIRKVYYRLFDTKQIFYHSSLVWRTVDKIMSNFDEENIALVSCRQVVGNSWQHVFLTPSIVDDSYLSNRSRERGYVFPLYLYEKGKRRLNLKENFVHRFSEKAESKSATEIFDYIYGYLHSNEYRIKYFEFLKVDFPRIPYPKNKQEFIKLTKLGSQLRHLHLMDDQILDPFITTFPEIGSDIVEQSPKYKNGNVYINDTQYFGNVPEIAWDFYIGGYQPAQKWLKDRKGKALTGEEIDHYQRMIVTLVETDRVMKEIDKVIEI